MTPKKPIRVADNWCSFFRGQPAKNKIGSVDKTSEIGPQGHFCEKKYTDFFFQLSDRTKGFVNSLLKNASFCVSDSIIKVYRMLYNATKVEF